MSTIRAATETTSLGRYQVVKRLAAGGMADVLLARTDGIEGFERHVVIKRIHTELLEEERYIKMFLDEARLAASLHHHNIVQVNDIGQDEGKYFFAMEYVHGEDARNLLVAANKRGQQIPLEHVITIVTGAAAGLHHAHEQRGADRSPLDIVHRDVSPANILIGFDGSVKVADFGIALAAHRAEQTQSGVLKGKVAYMSPEQCNCERVDRRSDVFSLGIVLYELATVRPCFSGDNDFMTMSAIVEGRIVPPSHVHPAIAPQLEAIILKALASSAADRYQTADELRVALEQYARVEGLHSSTTALADYMKEQFGTRALPWLEDRDDEPEIVITPAPRVADLVIVDDELAIPIERGRPLKETLPLRTLKTPIRGAAVSAMPTPTPVVPASSGPVPATPIVAEHTLVTRATPPARRWWLAGSIAAIVVAASALAVVVLGNDSRPVTSRATTPTRSYVTPLPAPTMARSAIEVPAAAPPTTAPAEPAATKPARKTRKRAKAAAPAPAPAAANDPAAWNRDALFPN